MHTTGMHVQRGVVDDASVGWLPKRGRAVMHSVRNLVDNHILTVVRISRRSRYMGKVT